MSRDYREFGFVRVAACRPVLALGDPETNAVRIASLVHDAHRRHAAITVFPELALTGYSCEDLFLSDDLLTAAHAGFASLQRETRGLGIVVVGTPYCAPDGRLFNVAFVLGGGRVLAAVPKTHLPNYGEYYEARWFASGADVEQMVDDSRLGRFCLACDQLVTVGPLHMAIELCEDLWAPQPPGDRHALAGAQLIVNPSASNELVGKADYRRELVRMASARRICGYVYASAGPWESSKDTVFGGHLLVAENGMLLSEGARFGLQEQQVFADLDATRINHDRAAHATFRHAPRPAPYRRVHAGEAPALPNLARHVAPYPFVPDRAQDVAMRAEEIFSIQATGLARRIRSAGTETLLLGLSGGLDSTLALLVARESLSLLGEPPGALHAVTMPGPATSTHTRETAEALARAAGVRLQTVNIDAAVAQHLSDLDHDPQDHSVVYENAQARERTQILFNLANKHHGQVVGTGDMSELALGWCTFGGDHFASYNVNAGVPKTLVRYLVRWYADTRAEPALAEILARVLATPISPELVPDDADEIGQRTEAIIGPYALHDFFLFHYLRYGSRPAKLQALAELAFAGHFEPGEIRDWMRVFFRRFFAQQFKRSVVPAGPKIGTVALSPRADWRMPDEASARRILTEIDAFSTGEAE